MHSPRDVDLFGEIGYSIGSYDTTKFVERCPVMTGLAIGVEEAGEDEKTVLFVL
jgi:hypothetical protein